MAEYTKIETARAIICDFCNQLYSDEPCEPADCDWLRMLEEDAADVAPVVHGAWIDFYGDHKTAECSKCQQLFEVTFDGPGKPELFAAFQDFYRYCPSCGARMDGGADNETD